MNKIRRDSFMDNFISHETLYVGQHVDLMVNKWLFLPAHIENYLMNEFY